MQSRSFSLLETIVSTAIGFLVSMAVLELVNQAWNLQLRAHDNFLITCIFTIASLLRGYGVRRAFNWYHHKQEINRGSVF